MKKSAKRFGVIAMIAGLAVSSTSLNSLAQERQIIPLTVPNETQVPAPPEGAQVTTDPIISQFMAYLLEVSRLIGGGIAELLGDSEKQLAALTGPKNFPIHDGVDDRAARAGGPSPSEMEALVLSGKPIGSDSAAKAVEDLKARYQLDNAFALQDDELLSKRIIARVTANGTVTAATAERTYGLANSSDLRLAAYIKALQESQDLKTSVDVNTRVLIEMTQQLNQSLRSQATTNASLGTYFMSLGADAAEPDSFADLLNFNR